MFGAKQRTYVCHALVDLLVDATLCYGIGSALYGLVTC